MASLQSELLESLGFITQEEHQTIEVEIAGKQAVEREKREREQYEQLKAKFDG